MIVVKYMMQNLFFFLYFKFMSQKIKILRYSFRQLPKWSFKFFFLPLLIWCAQQLLCRCVKWINAWSQSFKKTNSHMNSMRRRQWEQPRRSIMIVVLEPRSHQAVLTSSHLSDICHWVGESALEGGRRQMRVSDTERGLYGGWCVPAHDPER